MRTVRAALIQAQANMSKQEAIDKHIKMIADAAGQGAEVVGLQEIFHGPYFCAEQDPKWYDTAEPEDGPTVSRMREVAREHGIVLIVPWYEEEQPGVYYNTACVIERDGTVLGKYRKTHIPHVGPCFWEKFYFKPGNLGYPVWETSVGRVGLIICYDRHFPEVARELGLKGAELVFNPSATVESLSKYLWELEQPAHAVANGFWIAASNRVGVEAPLNQQQVLRLLLLLQPAREDHRPGLGQRGRGAGRRPRPRRDPRGPQHLAVLPRPPARDLRRAGPAAAMMAPTTEP